MTLIRTAKGASSGTATALPSFAHDWTNGQRVAISSSNAYSNQITQSNVVNVRPTVDCFITVSPSNSGGTAVPASATAATSWPLNADETYTVVLPNLTSYIAVIRETSDGFLYIHPALI